MQIFEFLLLNQQIKFSLTHYKYSLFCHSIQFGSFFAIRTNKIYKNSIILQLCECKIERIHSSCKEYRHDYGNRSILCNFLTILKALSCMLNCHIFDLLQLYLYFFLYSQSLFLVLTQSSPRKDQNFFNGHQKILLHSNPQLVFHRFSPL